MGDTQPRPALRVPNARIAVLAILICAFALTGCGKKHRILAPVIQPPAYEIPFAPEVVLSNLAKAYRTKDSTEYRSLFDDNYQGTSIDMRDPSPQLLMFTKAEESQHIAALARRPAVLVNLQLRPVLVRTADSGDPAGWAVIQNPIFALEISDGLDLLVVGLDEELIEFHFIPTLDSSSPTDTTWKIAKWVEVRQ
ncbi:MAG: hypothetical protein HY568_06590 [Candidatus Latescibacteria bacterium]|nr:hypothetical protein [Candidatus Latescibacterota bacterium]